MVASILSIIGLALDILGVLLLLFTTSQNNIQVTLWVTAVETNWIVLPDDESRNAYKQAKAALTWHRRIYKLAILLILIGFSLQIGGHLIAYFCPSVRP